MSYTHKIFLGLLDNECYLKNALQPIFLYQTDDYRIFGIPVLVVNSNKIS